MELLPILQRPFARDPVDDAIETDGFREKKISDLYRIVASTNTCYYSENQIFYSLE